MALVGLLGCGSAATPSDGGVDAVPMVRDRAAGQRQGLALGCALASGERCLSPWPSSQWQADDPSSPTGLRLEVPSEGLGRGDDPAPLRRADGYSRATPLVVDFPTDIDPATVGDGTTASLRLYVAQPGGALGRPVPLRVLPVGAESDGAGGLVAYPRAPLEPATEYVAVVLDSLRARNGSALVADRPTRVILDLDAPRTADEARLRAWHAPNRALLRTVGVDPSHVLRAWGFVTRSREQPLATFRAMRAAAIESLRRGDARVEVTSATALSTGSGVLRVEGFVRGLPRFLDADHRIARVNGAPMANATERYDAPFRVLLPRGTSADYPVVIFGHGLGGEVSDGSFDELLTHAGAAKVNVRFDGLTESEMINTFLGFQRMCVGADQAAATLLQALAGASAVIHSMRGQTPEGQMLPASASLREVLAAPRVGTTDNPDVGRRSRAAAFTWAGGSLGGSVGLMMVPAEPVLTAGVSNVAGGGWSHYLTRSAFFDLVRLALRRTLPAAMDIMLQSAVAQTLWDDVDGAIWADASSARQPILIQEVMGDAVLPNLGTEFAASAQRVVMVGASLAPVEGAMPADEAVGQSALTQYRLPVAITDASAVHGFAARDSIAATAALEQIETFLRGAWEGSPRVVLPALCRTNTPANSCDFSRR